MNYILRPIFKKTDSTRDDEEAENDFWTITGEFVYRHHVVHRVKLYVPKEESFPSPMKYIDATRTTYTSLDVMLEKILKITETWSEKKKCQMHGQDSQDLFYQRKGHRKDLHGPGGDLQGNRKLLVLTMYGQICGNLCPMQQRRKKNKDGLSRNQSSTMPDN